MPPDEDDKRPIYKKLDPSEEIGDIQCPMSIELHFATTSKISDMPILEKVLERAIEDVHKRFEKDGYKVYVRTGLVRPMTQEELVSLIPRKVHFRQNGRQICDTTHVAAKNLTDNRAEVTCKLCLKRMPPA